MEMKPTGYKAQYEASEARWNELRDHLQMCVDVAGTFSKGSINYDTNTLLQVIFKMDAMKEN